MAINYREIAERAIRISCPIVLGILTFAAVRLRVKTDGYHLEKKAHRIQDSIAKEITVGDYRTAVIEVVEDRRNHLLGDFLASDWRGKTDEEGKIIRPPNAQITSHGTSLALVSEISPTATFSVREVVVEAEFVPELEGHQQFRKAR